MIVLLLIFTSLCLGDVWTNGVVLRMWKSTILSLESDKTKYNILLSRINSGC